MYAPDLISKIIDAVNTIYLVGNVMYEPGSNFTYNLLRRRSVVLMQASTLDIGAWCYNTALKSKFWCEILFVFSQYITGYNLLQDESVTYSCQYFISIFHDIKFNWFSDFWDSYPPAIANDSLNDNFVCSIDKSCKWFSKN